MKRTAGRATLTAIAAIAAIVGAPGYPQSGRDQQAAVSVHETTISPRLLERRVTVYGQIVPEPAGPDRPAARASLSSATGGLVGAVPVVEGQAVAEGVVVVRMDRRQADATVESARAAVAQAMSEAERQKRLAEHDDSSPKQQELAERQLAEAQATLAAAEVARDYLDLRSPLSGTVLRVDVRPGEVIGAASPLIEIVNLDRLVAEVRIPASILPELRVGQIAEVEIVDRHVDGRLTYVGSAIDPADGTAAARITVAAARELHPGEFARARIVVESHPDALAAPVSAVVYAGEGSGAVVVLEDGHARVRPVTLGIEDGDWIEIEGDGVRSGTRIVTREAYGLPDGTPVRIVEEPASR